MLVGLRDGLRSGDVFVPGSRRYADPASFLLTAEAWAPQKVEFCHLVGRPVQDDARDDWVIDRWYLPPPARASHKPAVPSGGRYHRR